MKKVSMAKVAALSCVPLAALLLVPQLRPDKVQASTEELMNVCVDYDAQSSLVENLLKNGANVNSLSKRAAGREPGDT